MSSPAWPPSSLAVAGSLIEEACGAETDRKIEPRQLVSVPEGQRPSWELLAEVGS